MRMRKKKNLVPRMELKRRLTVDCPFGLDADALMTEAARQAAARGLKMWLYDEDAYPSGNLGGRLCMEHPEFAARSLTVEKIPPEKIPSVERRQPNFIIQPRKRHRAAAVLAGGESVIPRQLDICPADFTF